MGQSVERDDHGDPRQMSDDDTSNGRIRVLVVDDEPDFAEMAATFLEREHGGIDVETASTAEGGLERLAEDGPFDCVVSDYDMPGRDGLEFFEAVDGQYPDLPFILFTGKGSEEIAGEAISAGVTDYLQKTGGTEQYERLANRIAHATDARRAEREAAEARAYLEAVVRNATDGILTIDATSTIRFANGGVERILGYAPDEIEGEPLTALMPERFRDRHEDAVERYLETGEREIDWTGIEFPGRHRDGHEVPLSISFGEFTRDGERYFTGILRDLSDRKRREERLAGINEMLAEFQATDGKRRLCEVAAGAADGRLDLPVTAIGLFRDGSLVTAARTPAAERADGDGLVREDGAAWRAFTSGEPAEADGPVAALRGEAPVETRLLAHPLGRHGVFVTAVAADGAVDDERDFVRNVAGNLRDALDRVEREELLREREERLEEQNERLDRLNRINDVIRSIDQVLVGASTRGEIERAVCEELAGSGPYRFAWIGRHDSVTDCIVPREAAGEGSGYLDAMTAADGGIPIGEGPTGRAVRTGEPQVASDVLADPPFEPWREAAVERGYRSIVALPLVYRGRPYGVLTVCADRSGAFDELEREVLEELADTIAHAVSAVESKRALVSDRVVELEFEVDPSAIPLLEPLARASGVEFVLESVVPAGEGEYRVFVTVDGASPSDALGFAERSPGAADATVIDERDEAVLMEVVVTGENLVSWLLDHSAALRSLSVTASGARLAVELPGEADVRGFAELFESKYHAAELVARRERERDVRTRQGFRSELDDRLTARQAEVLRTAYHSGFFDSPRRRTGKDIADALGITQPTFSDHLRAGLRKLFELLYEERTGE